MAEITVKSHRDDDLVRFLNIHQFSVEDLGNDIYRVQRSEEIPVFLKCLESTLFFELDLGSLKGLQGEKFYFELLNMNSEILPVSFAINNSNADDPRLILCESRETADLDDHELLCVFDALELAVDRAEHLLNKWIQS